MKVHRTHQIDM